MCWLFCWWMRLRRLRLVIRRSSSVLVDSFWRGWVLRCGVWLLLINAGPLWWVTLIIAVVRDYLFARSPERSLIGELGTVCNVD